MASLDESSSGRHAKPNLKFERQNTTVAKLLSADEVFISSSLKLVVAVNKILVDGKTNPLPVGSVTGALAERFYRLGGIWS